MAAFLLQAGSEVRCAHGGKAVPLARNARIILQGSPACLMPGSMGRGRLPRRASGRNSPLHNSAMAHRHYSCDIVWTTSA